MAVPAWAADVVRPHPPVRTTGGWAHRCARLLRLLRARDLAVARPRTVAPVHHPAAPRPRHDARRPRGQRLRDRARVSFAKVAEFQRRGIVHFHAIIRLDGPATATEPYPTPAIDLGVQQLADLVRAAAAKVRLEAPPAFAGDRVRRLRFGTQLDVRPVRPAAVDDEGMLSAERVAAYIAKYATKACEDFGIPTGITGPAAARSPRRRRASGADHRHRRPARPPRRHPRGRGLRRVGPVAAHARLPRPLRHQIPPLLRHPRPTPLGTPPLADRPTPQTETRPRPGRRRRPRPGRRRGRQPPS